MELEFIPKNPLEIIISQSCPNQYRTQIEVFYQPSYSPEMNPEELLNANLKQAIGSKVPMRTKEKLRAAANNHMTMLENNPQRVVGLFHDQQAKYAT